MMKPLPLLGLVVSASMVAQTPATAPSTQPATRSAELLVRLPRILMLCANLQGWEDLAETLALEPSSKIGLGKIDSRHNLEPPFHDACLQTGPQPRGAWFDPF